MGFVTNLRQLFSPGTKSQQGISLMDVSAWERWGLNRKTTRIRYGADSAFRAYRHHELVFACINKIADVMNDAEIIVETKDAEGQWQKKEGHLLSGLFKRPNRYQTGRDVRRLMVQSEQSLGLFYAYLERSGAGIPVEMTVLNPNRITPKYTNNNTDIAYYEYTANNGKLIPIQPDDLLIRRRSDLLDQFNGFAPLAAAVKSINSDLGLTDYVDAFFENDGTPSGILKFSKGNLSDTKREALQADWVKKYSRGGSNQKGPAVLDENVDYQKIGSNLDELASDALSGRFESRICSVFGVPPNLVGAYVGLLHVTANATAKSELRNFWENKVSGELAALREWLTWFVLPQFEPLDSIQAEKVRVGFDVSQVMFLQEDVEQVHERSRRNFQAGGITLNEFREAIDMKPDPEGDYYLQPINVTALSPDNRAATAMEKVPAGGTQSPPAPDRAQSGDAQPEPAKSDPGTLEKKTFDYDGLTLGREPRGVETVIDLKKIVEDNASQKEKAIAILKRFRTDLITQAAKKLDAMTPETAHTLTLTPDPERRKQIAKVLKSAYLAGRQQIIKEINDQLAAQKTGVELVTSKAGDDRTWLELLDELTDGMVSRIINEISSRAINQYLALKLLNDYTLDALERELEDQSDKFLDQIAGNSVNAALSAGRDDEINDQADNIDHVEYSAILDANTCSPCEDADGETAADESDLPDAPNPACDGGGNCRCIHIAVVV